MGLAAEELNRPEDMNVRLELSGRGRSVTAPVVDVSYGGIAFRARKAEKWPPRWKAEIFQKNDPDLDAVKLRALNWAPLPGGECAWVAPMSDLAGARG